MLFNWEIRKVYEDMIVEYQDKIGERTEFGVIITEDFIETLRKRLRQLSIRKSWLLDVQNN
tara:strand:- start:483 stop:665 length:183 start_codon:yes stop_codon:yes gene_type:complete